MTPELAQEWCDALRSGKYRQCSEKLHRTAEQAAKDTHPHHREGYCCLGVLSEIATDRPEVLATGWGWDGQAWRDRGCYATYFSLPTQVRDAVGLAGLFATRLIEANDIGKRTFPQIADMIEREYITPAQSQTS